MQYTHTHAYKHTSLQNERKRNVAGFSLSYASNWNSDILVSQQQHREADVGAAPLTLSLSNSRVRAMKMPMQRERGRGLRDPLSAYVCMCMFFAPLGVLSLSLSAGHLLRSAFGFVRACCCPAFLLRRESEKNDWNSWRTVEKWVRMPFFLLLLF